MKFVWLTVISVIIAQTPCYSSSHHEIIQDSLRTILTHNSAIVTTYNETSVQLLLQTYEHYEIESFKKIVHQVSNFVSLQTNANNQEALRRKIIKESEKSVLAMLSKMKV